MPMIDIHLLIYLWMLNVSTPRSALNILVCWKLHQWHFEE